VEDLASDARGPGTALASRVLERDSRLSGGVEHGADLVGSPPSVEHPALRALLLALGSAQFRQTASLPGLLRLFQGVLISVSGKRF